MAIALVLLGLSGLGIDLYFLSLTVPLPRGLATRLAGAARACGVDGDACREVARTRHARLFFGIPNVFLGIAWSLVVIAGGAVYGWTGRFPLWEAVFAAALLSVALALHLTAMLVRVVRLPCRL